MQLAQRLVQLDPANTDNQAALSTAHNAVGAGRLAAGELEQAADAFRAAIAIRERLVEGQPGDAEFRRSLMIAYGNLGDVLGFRTGQNLGDVAGAIAAFEKAVALAEAARRADAADKRAIFDLGSAKLRLGAMLAEDPARRAAGLAELEEADRLTATLLVQEPGNARFGYNALVIGRRIGEALGDLGEPPMPSGGWKRCARPPAGLRAAPMRPVPACRACSPRCASRHCTRAPATNGRWRSRMRSRRSSPPGRSTRRWSMRRPGPISGGPIGSSPDAAALTSVSAGWRPRRRRWNERPPCGPTRSCPRRSNRAAPRRWRRSTPSSRRFADAGQ